jgi:hypothetical protein
MTYRRLLVFYLLAQPAMALPTMIRLGYPNCSSCHISPQGGGLLNLYGHSIDQAQSAFGGEYTPSDQPWVKALSWNGRITQDLRTVMQQQDVSTDGKPGTQVFRSRFMYRNATELGKGFRVTFTMTGENTAAPRPSLAYDPPSTPAQAFVNTALLSYRFSPGLELAAGRDQLPAGINIPDLSYFIRARNRLGYYDAPTQVKLFWWTKRYLVTPYAYAPGGNEKTGQHESGEGLLAEMDLFGKGRTVLGFNALHGTSSSENRTMVGPYARLGFGRWGILAEHDFVNRDIKLPTVANFNQQASYGQLFWAAREWLVPSLIVERIQVSAPYREHLDAIRLDLTARVAGQFTISAGPRIQKDEITGRIAKSVVIQIALKTVH